MSGIAGHFNDMTLVMYYLGMEENLVTNARQNKTQSSLKSNWQIEEISVLALLEIDSCHGRIWGLL